MSNSYFTSYNVPEDLVIEILGRLPVKTLIRFKCVCKTWLNIISDNPSFISRHLKHNTDTRVHHNVKYPLRIVLNKPFTRIKMKSRRNNPVEIPDSIYDFLRMSGSFVNKTFGNRNRCYSVVGYCDGLFCLTANQLERDISFNADANDQDDEDDNKSHNKCTDDNYDNNYNDNNYNYDNDDDEDNYDDDDDNDEDDYEYDNDEDDYDNMGFTGPPTIALCNPAIREINVLPFSDLDLSPPGRQIVKCEVGFCFDPKTKDYVVVKLVCLSPTTLDVVEIYSMKSNSWRTVLNNPLPGQRIVARPELPAVYTTTPCGAVVLHWITYRDVIGRCSIIISFHMDDDKQESNYFLRVTPIPSSYYERSRGVRFGRNSHSLTTVPCLGDKKLALTVCYHNSNRGQGNTSLDIWLMKDRDDIVDVCNNDDFCYWDLVFSVEEPLPCSFYMMGSWKVNVLMLYDHHNQCPYLYDIVSRKPFEIDTSGSLDFFYKESLISVTPQPWKERTKVEEGVIPYWMFTTM